MKLDIIKIILKNLLFILVIFILFEIAVFSIESIKYCQKAKKSAGFYSTKSILYSSETYDFKYDEYFLRPVEKEGKKHSIILFIDSFTYGAHLDEKETFSHKLAKATHSIVYNKSYPGWGVQHILYQLRRKDFYSQIKTSDYIIYTFIGDHVNRLNTYQYGGFWGNKVNLRYKEENGQLTEIKPLCKPLWHLCITKELQFLYESYLNSPANYSKNFDFFSLVMEESLKLARKHYPNVKFVILIYSNCVDSNPEKLAKFKRLEKDGFIILKTGDIVKENLNDPIYHFGEDCHPTAKAWDVIVPALVKKLNL